MSVTVELHQVTSIQPGPLYRVKNEVLTAVGIDKAVFVYKTVTQAFSHYATAADMEQWPNTYEAAVQASLPFFRQGLVQRDWPTVTAMQNDLSLTKARVQALLNQMNALQGTVASDTTTTLSAGV